MGQCLTHPLSFKNKKAKTRWKGGKENLKVNITLANMVDKIKKFEQTVAEQLKLHEKRDQILKEAVEKSKERDRERDSTEDSGEVFEESVESEGNYLCGGESRCLTRWLIGPC